MSIQLRARSLPAVAREPAADPTIVRQTTPEAAHGRSAGEPGLAGIPVQIHRFVGDRIQKGHPIGQRTDRSDTELSPQSSKSAFGFRPPQAVARNRAAINQRDDVLHEDDMAFRRGLETRGRAVVEMEVILVGPIIVVGEDRSEMLAQDGLDAEIELGALREGVRNPIAVIIEQEPVQVEGAVFVMEARPGSGAADTSAQDGGSPQARALTQPRDHLAKATLAGLRENGIDERTEADSGPAIVARRRTIVQQRLAREFVDPNVCHPILRYRKHRLLQAKTDGTDLPEALRGRRDGDHGQSLPGH